MKKSKPSSAKLLTEVELELMTILWRIGEGSVADVIEGLPKDRDLAYTSVSTILRILEQKEILKARKEGRGHVYVPLMKKSDYESKTVRHVVDKVFDGTPVALVRQLLSTMEMDDDELAELKRLVTDMGKKR
ncbi:MAG: BlaI/MecI/CopY family transcriptional regulator [Bdellovibrionota bacterium]